MEPGGMSQAAFRAATVELLEDYAASVTTPIKLQVYSGRPRTIAPPTAFIDTLDERTDNTGPRQHQRTISVAVMLVHGTGSGSFDSKEYVDQKDAFVDGFLSIRPP